MQRYCKAYHLKDLRLFEGWVERRGENNTELTDDTIVYLWDDFTVVESPVQNDKVLFDEITPEWRNFCEMTLRFEIPQDLTKAEELVS
jgi:hypothetical protein